LIFFVAKAERDVCGSGCSEWMAAAGIFDRPEFEQRFRGLLDAMSLIRKQ
jgi:hypothetical protein